MKNLLFALSLSVLIGTVLTLNSCKKSSSEDDSVSAQDANMVVGAMNLSADDASASAGQVSSFTGKTNGLYAALCGSTLVDSSINGTITITYDGTTTCYGIKRSGTITVKLTSGTHWQDVGAQLTITYNSLVAVNALTGATYTITGSHIITNESGGLAWQLAYGLVTNVTDKHRNQANMNVVLPSGGSRNWIADRTRIWTSVTNGSNNTITVTDTTEASGNVDVTGTNRYGNTFTNTLLQAITSNNNANCSYKPYAGKMQHQVSNRTTTVTYGTNSSGTQIGSPTVCGSGFYINYYNANNGRSAALFVPYW